MSFTNSPSEFQSHLLSGTGPFHDPLSIYSKGHKIYNKNNVNDRKDISGCVENVDLLNDDLDSYDLFNIDNIKLTKQSLSSDITIPADCSGLSVDLNFSKYNVITTSNDYINL